MPSFTLKGLGRTTGNRWDNRNIRHLPEDIWTLKSSPWETAEEKGVP